MILQITRLVLFSHNFRVFLKDIPILIIEKDFFDNILSIEWKYSKKKGLRCPKSAL